MRIGELSRRTGLSRDTIRFYERHGLIASTPSTESSNDYRDYPEELIEQLDMIMQAREAGLGIADLQTLTRFLDDPASGFDAKDFLDGKIAEVEHTIRQARKLLMLLKQTRQALKAGPVEWHKDRS